MVYAGLGALLFMAVSKVKMIEDRVLFSNAKIYIGFKPETQSFQYIF